MLTLYLDTAASEMSCGEPPGVRPHTPPRHLGWSWRTSSRRTPTCTSPTWAYLLLSRWRAPRRLRRRRTGLTPTPWCTTCPRAALTRWEPRRIRRREKPFWSLWMRLSLDRKHIPKQEALKYCHCFNYNIQFNWQTFSGTEWIWKCCVCIEPVFSFLPNKDKGSFSPPSYSLWRGT